VEADSRSSKEGHQRPAAGLVPTEIPEWQLFDLQEDPGESNNVIDKHPDIALPLKRKLQKLLEGPVAQ